MKEVGIVLAATLAAVAVLARPEALRAWAALGALVLTPVLLIAQIWDSEQVAPLRDRPATAAAAAAGGLALVGLAALAVHRRPAVLALAAFAALPFRVPVVSGGTTANLLVPLYVVIAAGVVAWAVPRLRGAERESDTAGRPRAVEWALMGFVVPYAAQASYSDDFDKALQQVVFFYVPFALLFVALRAVPWSGRLMGACLGVLVALAAAFVGVGFWEYHERELLLNPKVIAANQFESYFRVNSLFFDPNIYGRFLALVMIAVAAAVLWTARGRVVAGGTALLVLLWGGLVLTFSQSSFAALLAGLAVLAALRWSARWTAAALGLLAVAGAAIVLAAPGALHLDLGSSTSADRATSGRYDLMKGGVELFAERPVAGWGSGGFSRAYRREEHASSRRAVSASHTIPITVAAEQGAGGLVLYLAVVVLALAALLRGARHSAARAAVAAAFAALVVHTLLYAAFLEDPLAWVLLALGLALGGARADAQPD